MSYEFEKLLKANGKTSSDLPKELKLKINGFKLTIGKLAKNPTSPTLIDSVKRQDITLADAIQTFLENGLPESAPKETEEEKQAKIDAAKKAEEIAKKAKEDAEAEAAKNSETELRNKVVQKLNSSPDRYISASELESILGKKPEKKLAIGDLKLCEVYLCPRFYRAYK